MEKFIKPRLLTPSGQSHKKFWQAVGLCALTAAIFFLPFYILDGGFFHYAGDFNSQQISFYRYMNGFVKGAGYPDSAFAGAPHNTFSWATDLGSGVMNAYSFYLYGSPFFWLSELAHKVDAQENDLSHKEEIVVEQVHRHPEGEQAVTVLINGLVQRPEQVGEQRHHIHKVVEEHVVHRKAGKRVQTGAQHRVVCVLDVAAQVQVCAAARHTELEHQQLWKSL